ncbi:DUF4345 domain-containing protein [Oceanicaulis sp.]|uniref:DUF4345 domain-containing protein n=1 Tax=Oceanicaulis sp. TaxID=1924941 RepID=UPI003D2BA81E
MTTHGIIRALLGINGVVLTGIGVMLISDPHAMFALNGVSLSPDPNLLSELRAPGGALALGGGFVLASAALGLWMRAASGVSALLLLGWAIGRLVSIPLDGMPDAGLLIAFGIELVLGFASVWAMRALSESSALEAGLEPA